MLEVQGEAVVWVSVSPSLKYFDMPLLQTLMGTKTGPQAEIQRTGIKMAARPIERWEYVQSLDEASSLAGAIDLLVGYLKEGDRSVHLAGHGLSGVVAMLAAARCPEQVRSLSLLSVSVLPGLTWHAHYYLQRLATPCSQARILANCARSLWGPTSPYSIKSLVSLLEKDLLLSPSPHSLYHVAQLEPVALSVPTFIGMGDQDFVISPAVSQLWDEQLQSVDRLYHRHRLWHCPAGSHFFHTMFPEWVAEQLMEFWQQHEQADEGCRPQRIGFKVPQTWGS